MPTAISEDFPFGMAAFGIGYWAFMRMISLPSTAGLETVKITICTAPVVTMDSDRGSGVQVTRSVEVSTVLRRMSASRVSRGFVEERWL